MAGTVETDLAFFIGASTTYSDCETITDWSPAPTADTVDFIQGSTSNSVKVSKASPGTVIITYFSIKATLPNLTNKLVVFWAMTVQPSILRLKSEGGLGIRIESSAGNYKDWYLAGNNTWGGAWTPFAIHTGATANASAGTLDLTAVSKIGIIWAVKALAKVTPNCFWDAVRWGTGLSIRGGTSGAPATFDDFITAEDLVANKYGLMSRENGILISKGNVTIGNSSTWPTYFKDTSEVLVYRTPETTDFPAQFYTLTVQGNSSTITEVYFGDPTTEVSGCAFRTSGAPKFNVVAPDPSDYLNTFGLFGTNFFDASTITFPNVADSRAKNTNFEAGAKVDAQLTQISYCNFISADDIACKLPLVHNLSYCSFINNPKAIEVASAGTIDLVNVTFIGNTYDIYFSAGSGVLVVKNTNSDATTWSATGSGTVDIQTSLPLIVYVSDEDGGPIQDAQTAIFLRNSPYTQLMNEDTDGTGKASEGYTGSAGADIVVRVRKSTPGVETRYVSVRQYATIGLTGLTLYITLARDTVAAPT